MKDLLKCEDLLKNDRVRDACDAMGVDLGDYSYVSMSDVAFAMRDAHREQHSIHTWEYELRRIRNYEPTNLLRETTATEWVIAAVFAWEAAQ